MSRFGGSICWRSLNTGFGQFLRVRATSDLAEPSQSSERFPAAARGLRTHLSILYGGGIGSLVGLILDILLVVLVCLVILLEFRDKEGSAVIIACALPVYSLCRFFLLRGQCKALKFSWIDAGVVGVIVIEVITFFTSTYRANSFDYLCEVFIISGLFLLFRLGGPKNYQRVLVYLFITLLAFWTSSRALYSFYLHWQRLAEFGFTDLTDFKHLFFLVGANEWATGERISVLFLLLPFPLSLMLRFRKRPVLSFLFLAPVVTILLALSITFMRGVYCAVAVFLVATPLLSVKCRLASNKTIMGLVLAALLLIIIGLLPVRRSVITTISTVHTQSQIRSIEGRKDMWQAACSIFKRHPFVGIGANNFPMQFPYSGEERPEFVINAFQEFLQILAEKGIAGLLAYLFLFIVFFRTAVRFLRQRIRDQFATGTVIFSLASVASALARDITYSSILITPASLALLWLIFADVACLDETNRSSENSGIVEPQRNPHRNYRSRKRYVPVLAALTFSIVLGWSVLKRRTEDSATASFDSYVKSMQLGQFEDALGDINEAVAKAPGNAYYHAALGFVAARRVYSAAANHLMQTGATRFGPENQDEVDRAIREYLEAIRLNPNDDSFYHNLGWVYWIKGDRQSAIDCFEKAVALDGGVPAYRVSLAQAYERTSQTDKAASQYAAAIRISPSILASVFFRDFNTRSASEAKNCVDQAIDFLEKEYAQKSNAILDAKLGRLNLERNPQKAREHLSKASAEMTALSRVWVNLGEVDEQSGDTKSAMLDYRKGAYLDSADYVPSAALGRLYEKEGDYNRAIESYTLALGKWQGMISVHAYRSSRMYRANTVLRNDIFPSRMLAYTAPAFDWKEVCSRISNLYLRLGDAEKAASYRALGEVTVY